MNPAPSIVVWESLKQGMVVWPYADATGLYYGLPIYPVAALLLIVAGVVALAIHLMSKPAGERR